MRGHTDPLDSMFFRFDIEERIPADHPLRQVRRRAGGDNTQNGADMYQEIRFDGYDFMYRRVDLPGGTWLDCN